MNSITTTSASAALPANPHISFLPGGQVRFGARIGEVGGCLPVLHWEITTDPQLQEPLRHGLTAATESDAGYQAEVTVMGLTPGRRYCGRFSLAGQSSPWMSFRVPQEQVERRPQPMSAA